MTTTTTTSAKPSNVGLANANALIQKVFDATETAINNLAVNERISLKSLTERVAAFLGLPQSTVAAFVSMWVKEHKDICTSQKGRKGGIYRGKPLRKEDLEPHCPHCHQKLRAAKAASARKTAKAA